MRDNPEPETNPKAPRKIARIILIVLGGIVVISILTCSLRVNNYFKVHRATADPEWILTEAHGEEVRDAIEHFASTWYSVEARRDPSIRMELAITDAFNKGVFATPENGLLCEVKQCFVYNKVEVTSIRVLEYSQKRFKAIVCTTADVESLTPQGEFIRINPKFDRRTLYVFVYVDDTWKLEGSYDITIAEYAYRDWEHYPETKKQILDPLPDSFSCEVKAPN